MAIKIQGQTVIDDNQVITLNNSTGPNTPTTGRVSIYSKSDNKVYTKNSQGTELELLDADYKLNVQESQLEIATALVNTQTEIVDVRTDLDALGSEKLSIVDHTWNNLTNTPNTLSGYNLTDLDLSGNIIPTTTHQYNIGSTTTLINEIHAASLNLNNVSQIVTKTVSTASTSPTVLTLFDITKFRSAKYLVQISTTTSFNATEILVLHDGISVNKLEYGTITINSSLADLDAIINNNNLELIVTSTSATPTHYKIIGQLISI